ncbi:MAG: hypothetical protein AAF587_37840 [Bacteroidota bacterium]
MRNRPVLWNWYNILGSAIHVRLSSARSNDRQTIAMWNVIKADAFLSTIGKARDGLPIISTNILSED